MVMFDSTDPEFLKESTSVRGDVHPRRVVGYVLNQNLWEGVLQFRREVKPLRKIREEGGAAPS
ncbi:UDP-glucose 6-dehydrogenase [Methanofollis sp. W23]|nr:UDP-glucose 6-dehydrogenase [Methanofollis sp. W23]